LILDFRFNAPTAMLFPVLVLSLLTLLVATDAEKSD